eukprot:scaffold1729_cov117-Cylindrotheca_fusiformis.AAC.6
MGRTCEKIHNYILWSGDTMRATTFWKHRAVLFAQCHRFPFCLDEQKRPRIICGKARDCPATAPCRTGSQSYESIYRT